MPRIRRNSGCLIGHTANYPAVSSRALRKADEIDKAQRLDEKEEEYVTKQTKFVYDYKICPICSEKLETLNVTLKQFIFAVCESILHREPNLYCKKCKKTFRHRDIKELDYY